MEHSHPTDALSRKTHELGRGLRARFSEYWCWNLCKGSELSSLKWKYKVGICQNLAKIPPKPN